MKIMGSTVNQYLMLGIRLGYDEADQLMKAQHGEQASDVQEKYEDNGYEEGIGHFEGVSLIADGMNGEYMFFGIIKKKTRADDWLENVSIERPKPKDVRLVQEKAKALFGLDAVASPGWHVITHWH